MENYLQQITFTLIGIVLSAGSRFLQCYFNLHFRASVSKNVEDVWAKEENVSSGFWMWCCEQESGPFGRDQRYHFRKDKVETSLAIRGKKLFLAQSVWFSLFLWTSKSNWKTDSLSDSALYLDDMPSGPDCLVTKQCQIMKVLRTIYQRILSQWVTVLLICPCSWSEREWRCHTYWEIAWISDMVEMVFQCILERHVICKAKKGTRFRLSERHLVQVRGSLFIQKHDCSSLRFEGDLDLPGQFLFLE